MKRHINSPYKMNWKMYGLIGGISVLIMIIAVICNDNTGTRSYKEDGIFFLIYLAAMILFFTKEKIGKGDETMTPSDALLEELGALVQKYKSL